MTGSGSTLTFTQGGLTPGLQYYFLVNAINIVGTGADSVSTPIIAGTVPDQPQRPVLISQSSSSVSFSFAPSTTTA